MSFAGFPAPPGSGPPTSPGGHNLLSSTHSDTVASSPIIGDIIISPTGTTWNRLPVGNEMDHLVVMAGVPGWHPLSGSGLGNVTGPSVSADDCIARFIGTSGMMIDCTQVYADDDGNLSVQGDIFGSGDLTILGSIFGDIDLAASGFVQGPASAANNYLSIYDGITGKLIKVGQASLDDNGNLTVAGDIFGSGSLTILGTTTLEGDLNVGGNILGSGDLRILGDTTLEGDLDVAGNTTISGDLNVVGSVFADVDLSASGFVVGPASAVDLQIALYDGISGKVIRTSQAQVQIDGTITTPGGIEIGGNATVTGDLSVLGSIDGDIDLAASGFVVGPATSTDSAIALYDGTTGELIKDSSLTSDGSSLTVPGDLTVTGSLVSNGLVINTVSSGTADTYTITDVYFNAITSATTGVLMPTSPTVGQQHVVKDVDGVAGTTPIIIDGNGNTIDGSSTTELVNNYESATLIFGPTEWNII